MSYQRYCEVLARRGYQHDTIDPHEYLNDVLRRLPNMKITEIVEITPAARAKARKSKPIVP